MNRRVGGFIGGALLILIGLFLLLIQIVPGLENLIRIELTWPLIIIGAGGVLLVLGIALGEPGMAVPACIVGGIGGLLYWQNMTGNWESWGYAWTLISGFAGVGVLLSSVLGGKERASEGLRMILVSAILFGIFGSLLGAIGFIGNYWPLLLILLGLILLAQGIFRRRGE